MPLRTFLGPALFGTLKGVTGFGFNFRLGNTFTHVKLVEPDKMASPSRLLDSDLRYKVIGCRGVGTDLWDSALEDLEGLGFAEGQAGNGQGEHDEMEDDEILGHLGESGEMESGWRGGVRTVEWVEAWGGVLQGFEERFYAAMEGRRY